MSSGLDKNLNKLYEIGITQNNFYEKVIKFKEPFLSRTVRYNEIKSWKKLQKEMIRNDL